MPIVTVTLLEGRSPEVKKKIAAEITETMTKHTGSSSDHIYIVFEDVKPENWAWKGELFSNLKK